MALGIAVSGVCAVQGAARGAAGREAYLLAHNDAYDNHRFSESRDADVIVENMEDGWVFDNRGGEMRTDVRKAVTTVRDVSTTEGTALIRTFSATVTDDMLTADFVLAAIGNGVYAEFSDENGDAAWRVVKHGNAWNILTDAGEVAVYPNAGSTATTFRVVLDVPNGLSHVYINHVDCGESALLSDNIASFRFATEKEAMPTMTPGKFEVTANYAVYENFDVIPTPKTGVSSLYACYGWQTGGDVSVTGNAVAVCGDASFSKTFTPPDGAYVFEAMLLIENRQSTALTLSASGTPVVTVETTDGVLSLNGEELYTLAENVWQRIRVTVDPDAGEAQMRLNGRVIGAAALLSDLPADTLSYEQTAASASDRAQIDDIRLSAVIEREDYVPEPVTRANLDDYIVGVNSCNIWKDSFGWDVITPFAEEEPVLGYYDEGNSETADWEIKYLVEHGVDVQGFCWYLRSDSRSAPIKSPPHVEHLYAYQYAKYADYMKYCLICEANTSTASSDGFKNYVVPYWFENFFLDDRYLKIDNKPVLLFFAGDRLVTSSADMGGEEGVAEAMAFLEETARAYGFDGMLLFNNNAGMPGMDARFAYGWGEAGFRYDFNISQNEASAAVSEANGYYTVPTVSVGYNIVAWKHRRSPNMTVADFKKTLLWARDGYLPAHAAEGTWQEKVVWLSNWNEYGEGTYLMPSGLNGFGYLDAVKDVFAENAPDAENAVPTQAQKARINRLYPQSQTLLSRLFEDYQLYEEPGPLLATFPGAAYTSANYLKDISTSGGALSAVSVTRDPQIRYDMTDVTDTSLIKRVRVDMKVKKNTLLQLFFAVDDLPLAETRSIRFYADSDERKTYVFNVSASAEWSGELRYLRLDPADIADLPFTVYGIALEGESDLDRATLTVDGADVKSVDVPCGVTDDGRMLFAFDPRTAVSWRLNTVMRFDRKAGMLSLEGARGRSAVFTVGSDRYYAGGEAKSLGYTLYAKDGLPMLDFTAVADALGFLCETTEDGGVSLVTPRPDDVRILSAAFSPDTVGFEAFFAYKPETPAVGLAAFYDGDGRLVSIKTAPVTAALSKESVSIRLPAGNVKTAKIMIFDSLTSLRPLAEEVLITRGDMGETDFDTSPLFD